MGRPSGVYWRVAISLIVFHNGKLWRMEISVALLVVDSQLFRSSKLFTARLCVVMYWFFCIVECLKTVNNVTKIFFIPVKGFEPGTSCVRDQDATAAPARHMWETGSLNGPQVRLQWLNRFPHFHEFIEFNESSAPFRKTPILTLYWDVRN